MAPDATGAWQPGVLLRVAVVRVVILNAYLLLNIRIVGTYPTMPYPAGRGSFEVLARLPALAGVRRLFRVT